MVLTAKQQVKRVIKQSSTDFKKYVWPKIKHEFDDSKLITLENTIDGSVAKYLDKMAGVDALLLKNRSIQTVATRIQYDFAYNSFSIRIEQEEYDYDIEYQKRSKEIENNYLSPKFTIQAYLSKNNNFLSCAIIKTKDLVNFIKNNKQAESREKYQNDYNSFGYYLQDYTNQFQQEGKFAVVEWKKLESEGVDITIIK